MSLIQALRRTCRIAIDTQNRMFGGLVMALGAVWALGALLVLQEHISFEYHEPDVAVWNAIAMSTVQYPQQQEIFYYFLTLLFVPLFSLTCWGGWLLFSSLTARVARVSPQRLLRWDALTFLPFVLIVGEVHSPERTLSRVLLWPCLLFVGTKALLVLAALSHRRKGIMRPRALEWIAAKLFPEEASCWEVPDEPACGEPHGSERDSSVLPRRATFLRWIFAPQFRQAHWYPIAAGQCVGVYFLVQCGVPSLSLLQGLGIEAASTAGLWLLWIGTSHLMAVLFEQPKEKVLVADAPTYLPFALLLGQTLLFGTPHASEILPGLAILLCVAGKMLVRRGGWQLSESASRLAWCLLTLVLVPALIWAFLYDSNIHGEIDLFHEGERLGPASDLLRGKIPFRDIYVQHGLFQDVYKTWLAFKLFGVSVSADRSLSNSPFGHSGYLTPLGFVAAYFFATVVCRRRVSAILAMILLLAVGVWLTERHVLVFVVYSLVASVLDNRRAWKLWLAGAITTLALFNSIDTGLYALLVSCSFLVVYALMRRCESSIERLLLPGRYALGVLAGLVPFLIFFGFYGAVSDMLWVSYVECAYQNSIWGLPFPALLPRLTRLVSIGAWSSFLSSTTFKWYLPILVFVIGTMRLVYVAIQRRLESDDWKLALLLLAGIAFFRTALGRSDFPHLLFATAPFWILCVVLLERVVISATAYLRERGATATHWRIGMHVIPAATLLFACGWYLFVAYAPLREVHKRLEAVASHGLTPSDHVPLGVARAATVRVPAPQADAIRRIVTHIQSHTKPDEYIFDFTNQGAYYFLANRPNATRYYMAAYAATEQMQEEVVADLEEKRPQYVLAYPDERSPSGFVRGNASHQIIIGEYLHSHYRTPDAAQIAGVTFLKRLPAQ